MCHINLIHNKKGRINSTSRECMNVVSWSSWKSNDDGEGVIQITGDKINWNKSLNKLIYKQNHATILTHQRYTTSGKGNHNTHPHKLGNLLLMHNGVMTGGDDKESDTKVYFKKLNSKYLLTRDLISSIKEINKEQTGSYSIFVLDLETKKLYYYKNSSTNMFYCENSEWLLMSTSESNVDYMRTFLKVKGSIKSVKEEVIYEVNEKGLEKIDTFEVPQIKKDWITTELKNPFENYSFYENSSLNYTEELKFNNFLQNTYGEVEIEDIYKEDITIKCKTAKIQKIIMEDLNGEGILFDDDKSFKVITTKECLLVLMNYYEDLQFSAQYGNWMPE